MASIFQSFRSSAMPKRLLRYALSRLELLDAEALDMENLDFALGRNTVLEFRDVGIKLKKLEKLLKFPPAFQLLKAKVLVLRVTIPMDFYTSPIIIEVDGVDVKLKLEAVEPKSRGEKSTTTQDGPGVVPNTADLAQSFLDTQPLSERKKLEDALAAESQDLGASVTMSDDGSEEEPGFGTGEPLTLPTFLADFLQGIVDRMQVRIKSVTFQLGMEAPVDIGSTKTEPVAFQVSLSSVDVEGVTTALDESAIANMPSKEGKRAVSLSNVRACLISEANVFAMLTRTPSMASPSIASSPALTRNPPSRQTSLLSQESSDSRSMTSSRRSIQSYASHHQNFSDGEEESLLTDSEDALGIPYDLSVENENLEDDSPATPRASIYHELDSPDEELSFYSTNFQAPLPPLGASKRNLFSDSVESSVDLEGPRETPTHSGESKNDDVSTINRSVDSLPPKPDGRQSTDNLNESRIYTHDEAESMYMSAFSSADRPREEEPQLQKNENDETRECEAPKSYDVPVRMSSTTDSGPSRPVMPGGWGEELDESTHKDSTTPNQPVLGSSISLDEESAASGSGSSSPAFSRTSLAMTTAPEDSQSLHEHLQDDAETPKGITRVAKEIMHLDNISVYIPSQHQHIQVHAASPEQGIDYQRSAGQSVYPQAPGAFSVHQGNSPSVTGSAINSSVPRNIDTALEIVLSPMTVKFDISIGFLLAVVIRKLTEALQGVETSVAGEDRVKSTVEKAPEVKVLLEDVSVDFVSRLSGIADTVERHLDPTAFMLEEEILLNASLHALSISMSSLEANKVSNVDTKITSDKITKIELEKFRFGYTDGDIISFDSGRPMSTSVRDTFLSTGHDVGVKILQAGDKIKTDVETLPLVIQIDLQRLDETFSWFGGLSSFLNMSTSMTSNQSPVVKPAPLPARRPRGVRFETPINPDDKSAASQNKVNVRIGGSFVELVGKECSVTAESNAVKLVSRDEGIGMACSMIRVSGPYLDNSAAEPAVMAEIGGVRLDFLTAPTEIDLEKLLELIMPSKNKFDDEGDEIMVDTLLRQRRNGSVMRTNVEAVNIRIKDMAQLAVVPNLGEEVAKLSTVAKYLPEDDRPGLLTFLNVSRITAGVDFGGKIGHIGAETRGLEVGHITLPALVAFAVSAISIQRNKTEELVTSTTLSSSKELSARYPVITGRMIGDDIEPVTRLRLRDIRVEYRVPTIMDVLGLSEDATPQDFEECLAASVADLGDRAHAAFAPPSLSPVEKPKPGKPMTLDVRFGDCLIGLNPLNLSSKMVVALTDSHLEVILDTNEETRASFDIKKASVLLTDDVSKPVDGKSSSALASAQIIELSDRGFVEICYISSAKILANVGLSTNGEKMVEIEVGDDLLILETCADSTQTLITLANALKPPTPPSKENKYRTNVMPVQDLLASISAEAFGRPEGEYDFDQDFAGAQEMAGSGSDADFGSDSPLRVDSQYYGQYSEREELFDALNASELSQGTKMQDTQEGVLLTGFDPSPSNISEDSDDLVIHDNFYEHGSNKVHGAKVWNSSKNTYDEAPSDIIRRSPVKVSVKDVHVIWKLFDGYDWAHTRETISKAVHEVEVKAYERQSRLAGPDIYEEEVGDETIGDFLFNSIYIGIPANQDPNDLSRAINEGLHDNATETESIATTAITATANRASRRQHSKAKHLRLHRSKRQKITFELQGVNVEMVAFPPGCGETQSSIDVRVQNLDIFDDVPSSTWRKFATYDQDKGERELGTSMVHLEILNVQPLPELGASEIVMRATVLPLRLHVDQDALDFITRFFEFKDDKTPVHSSPSDVPFLQRAEVNDIPVKLDFKPKRVDYGGLRSGHTTEFMNFIVLQEARMVLRHVIIYGVSGFDRLGKTLNDIWMPDVRNNQLPGVIAGLAPVRSIVNIGSGFKDLVEIPLREYQKDGRVIRSISKGAAAFARTTGTELVKLGAKLAVGTQYALQGAEDMLNENSRHADEWDGDDLDPDDKKQISLYADQPTGVIAGVRGGYRSLTRDVNLARDAIIAVPGEVMESQSASGAARAVWKRAPTIIFRPAVGVTKVIGKTLMGATNSIDPHNRRRIGEKYKH